ncbi:MAG: tRNA pseudouridine(38-40) synthase TruA, partial [Alphaproteobacteria bacterium]
MEELNFYRYKLDIEYDGVPYCGFQLQYEEGLKTIEGELLRAISSFANFSTKITASGRTDAGVHAIKQTINFDLPKKYNSHQIIMGLNYYLKEEKICVLDAILVDRNFSARFDAKMRYYRYIILNRKAPAIIDKNRLWHIGGKKLSVLAMQNASQYLIGEHDFSAFRAAECQARSPVRTMHRIEVRRVGDLVAVSLRANAFLHHMVRNIVGSLIQVGNGNRPPEWIAELLKGRDRELAAPTFSPYGLYLARVDYDARWG